MMLSAPAARPAFSRPPRPKILPNFLPEFPARVQGAGDMLEIR
jgi:hypothetical protein